MAAPYVELDMPLNEYALVCRGCLADSGEMKNIREWNLTEDFCIFSGLRLKPSETISELLCTTCEDTLMSCKRFRSQCQNSDTALRNVASLQKTNKEDSDANKITFTLNSEGLIYYITAPDMECKIKFTCPYNCKNSYIKKKDLANHLIRSHDKSDDFHIDTRYFCSHDHCVYNEMGTKWFNERKLLNQHYNKVHKSKDFHCVNCDESFPLLTGYNRHLKTCNVVFKCEICAKCYNTNERLLVHLMRNHPDFHKEYKASKKAEKRKSQSEKDIKKLKADLSEYLIDSPKRNFATQTYDAKDNIKNDVTLPPWQTKKDEISTQTAFGDVLSLKSEDDIFFSETVSLSDIQTQTFPEFASRSNKETLTENAIDFKWTQTCVCNFESPKLNYRLFESISSSPGNNLMTNETADVKSNVKSDVLLSLNLTANNTSTECKDIL